MTKGDLTPSFLLASLEAGRVAVDIETTGLDWRKDAIGTVQVHVAELGTAVVQVDESVPHNLVELMTSARAQKVFHHAPFDLRFMAYHWKVRPVNVADTKLVSRILEPAADHASHSLAPLVHRFFDVALDKTMRQSDWVASELTEQQISYAARDVEYLMPLLDRLKELAITQGVADVVEASFGYLPVRVATDLMDCGDVFSY